MKTLSTPSLAVLYLANLAFSDYTLHSPLPDPGYRRSFTSCPDAYGDGSTLCGNPHSSTSCFDPTQGQTCCSQDNGYCNPGDVCAPVAGFCCHADEDAVDCVLRLNVSLGLSIPIPEESDYDNGYGHDDEYSPPSVDIHSYPTVNIPSYPSISYEVESTAIPTWPSLTTPIVVKVSSAPSTTATVQVVSVPATPTPTPTLAIYGSGPSLVQNYENTYTPGPTRTVPAGRTGFTAAAGPGNATLGVAGGNRTVTHGGTDDVQVVPVMGGASTVVFGGMGVVLALGVVVLGMLV